MAKNVPLEEGEYRYCEFKKIRYPMPHLPSIRYEFFQVAITAFMQDLRRLLKQFMPDVPIYIFNTGDQLLTDEFVEATGQEIPRVVVDVDGLSIASDQLTNPYERGQFILRIDKQDIGYSANLRRIPITLDLPVKITVSNVIEQLKWMEILLLILYRNNLFHFQYYKKDNRGIYRLPDSFETERNVEFGFDDQRRNRVVNITVSVDLQYPAFDIFDTTSLMASDNNIKSFGTSIYPDPNSNGETGDKEPTPGTNSVTTTYDPNGEITSELDREPEDPDNPSDTEDNRDPDKPDSTFTGPDAPDNFGTNTGIPGSGNNNYSVSETDNPFGKPSYPTTGDSLLDEDGNPIDYDLEAIKDEIIGMSLLPRKSEVKNPNATNSWEPAPPLSVHKPEDVGGTKYRTDPKTGDFTK